jgi:hypothetical protein
MKLLLKSGADVSAGKLSPLFSAIQAQDLQSLTTLLDAGVSPDSRDTTNTCQVHWNVKDQTRLALFCASRPYIMNQSIKKFSSTGKTTYPAWGRHLRRLE